MKNAKLAYIIGLIAAIGTSLVLGFLLLNANQRMQYLQQQIAEDEKLYPDLSVLHSQPISHGTWIKGIK